MSRTLLRARNVLKAWVLLFGLCAILGIVPLLAGDYRLLSIFLFCALLLAGAGYFYADRIALGMVGARELVPGEAPAVHSTVERLAALAGIPKPKLYLLRDGYPRAMSAGRGPRGSAVAVSRGLLSATPPAELEGVLAHELAHIRDRDVLIETSVSVMAAALVELSRLGGWLERALLFVLGPLAASLVQLVLSPRRGVAAR